MDVAYGELKKARDEAVQVADAKSKFMATMSHEIRTPMNGVLGMTEILRGTSLDSNQQTMVQKIQDSGNHLLAVINDILDFSKIESQKLKLVSEEFNLRDLLEENLDMMVVQASMKNLELVKSFAVSLDRRFIGDPNRINQIMVNLVGNAIKFTEKGQVVVKAEISERESGPAMLRVEVADTGIGISTEQQSYIFKEFSQADDSLARQYQGTGLGLAICNALLGLMGGEIGLESELGKGSCFRFELPLQEAEVPRLTTKDRNSLGDLRVLVLCNEGPGFADICRELENCEMTYTVQDKPSDPVAILKSAAESGSDFDLALLDWDMSGSDGLQAARKIREEDQFTGLPIALIGWPEDGEQRLISSDVYIDRYLIKPVSRASLRACLIDLSDKLQKCPTPADSVTVEPEPEKIQAEVLLVEDNRVNQQVGKTLLEENGCRVTIAENGAVALDILQEQQFDLVFMDCHMPEMDGFEATSEIRCREAATQTHIPIVALTADVVEGVREKCLDAGMDDYLTKPFSALQLREVLKSWLS